MDKEVYRQFTESLKQLKTVYSKPKWKQGMFGNGLAKENRRHLDVSQCICID